MKELACGVWGKTSVHEVSCLEAMGECEFVVECSIIPFSYLGGLLMKTFHKG